MTRSTQARPGIYIYIYTDTHTHNNNVFYPNFGRVEEESHSRSVVNQYVRDEEVLWSRASIKGGICNWIPGKKHECCDLNLSCPCNFQDSAQSVCLGFTCICIKANWICNASRTRNYSCLSAKKERKNTEGARSETWKVAFWSPFILQNRRECFRKSLRLATGTHRNCFYEELEHKNVRSAAFHNVQGPMVKGSLYFSLPKKIPALDSTQRNNWI
jgi:hypothetical protein